MMQPTHVEGDADNSIRNRRRQMVGAGTLSVSLLLLGITFAATNPSLSALFDPTQLALSGVLLVAVCMAYQFPIYIRHNTKLCVFSIPLFVVAALIEPAPAGLVALLSVAAGEVLVMRKRGSLPGDIATHAGRWSALVMAASAIVHVPFASGNTLMVNLTLVAAGVVLWSGDVLTLPLALVPLTGEKATRLIPAVVREGGLAEAAQYVVGLIGVLLVQQQIWAIGLLVLPAVFVYMAFKKEMDSDTFALLESMADTIDMRDPYLAEHSRRVAALVKGMLEGLGMNGQEARHILVAARLHDIGKVEVPRELFMKTGTLTAEERELVESAPERGAQFLSAYPDFSRGIAMVRHHLERWDGSGRPDHLSGPEIPFGARMIAVADSYDAMTSERSYRRALTPDAAAQILAEGRGRQWDPRLVDVLLASISDRLTNVPTRAFHAPAEGGTLLTVPERITA